MSAHLLALAAVICSVAACPTTCSCEGTAWVRCTGRNLSNPPAGPYDPGTRALDLSRNSIVHVRRHSFANSGLQYLLDLSLRSNVIESVHLMGFSRLREMQSLDLSFNKLATISADVFAYNVHLAILSVAGNRGFQLPQGLKAPWLIRFNSSGCNVSSVRVDAFDLTPNVEVLDLSRNGLLVLPDELRARMPQLRELLVDEGCRWASDRGRAAGRLALLGAALTGALVIAACVVYLLPSHLVKLQ